MAQTKNVGQLEALTPTEAAAAANQVLVRVPGNPTATRTKYGAFDVLSGAALQLTGTYRPADPRFAAVADGVANDSTAIGLTISAMGNKGVLDFGGTTSAYYAGVASFDLPPGSPAMNVAGLSIVAQDRLNTSSAALLTVVSDAHGLIGPRNGYVFDGGAGRIVHEGSGLVFSPSAVAVQNDRYLVAVQVRNDQYSSIRTMWSDDDLASLMFSDWLRNEETSVYTATGATSTTIVVAGAGWTVNQFVNQSIRIKSGTGIGGERRVASNTSTTLTIDTAWTVTPSAGSTFTMGRDYYDPELAVLPNGHVLCATQTGDYAGSGLYFMRSLTGGRTWSLQTSIPAPAGHIYGAVKMCVLRQGFTGAENRIVILFGDFDAGANTISYRTAISDDECATWGASTVIASGTIGGLANQINDAHHGAIYERSGDATIHCIIPFKNDAENFGRIYHVKCNNGGTSPSAPQLITTVPRITGSGFLTRLGSFPHVVRLRTGEYGLYYTAADFANGGQTGELHFIPSTTGDIGSFTSANDRTISSITGMSNGYGFVKPFRKPSGVLELLHVAVPSSTQTQVRSVIHYGV